MPEEFADSPDDDPELLRTSAAAWEWLHLGRWRKAELAFARALDRLRALRGHDALCGAWQRRLNVGLADALANLGRRSESEAALLQAYPHLGCASAGATHEANEVLALTCLARLRQAERRPAEAAAALQSAQELMAATAGVDSAASLQQARLWSRQAVSMGMQHDVAAALECHAKALAVFEHPLLTQCTRERAVELGNQGANLWRSGRTREAQAPMRRAIALFQGLADSGRRHELGYVAISQMNLGGVLTELGAVDEAISVYRDTSRTYDDLLRLPAEDIDRHRLRASRALTDMNLAYALAHQGRFDEAAAHYRGARRRYKALALEQPQVRDDEARTWINQAHLLLQQGRAAAAQRLYARGWQALQALLDGGGAHFASDVANARLGLARALARQGRWRRADEHFSAAQATLVELTQQGQLQHARAWLKALADHTDALLAGPGAAPAAAQALLAALAQPPHLGLPDFASARRDIDEGLARLAAWTATPGIAAPWLPALAAAYLTHLLDRCAWLLGECDPEVLRHHEADRAALVTALGRAAQALPQAPRLLADWFLRTRGLRAQRSALAEGRDARLVDLRERLARLRRVEEDILASSGAAPAEATARWLALHQDTEERRARLVAAGLLPAALRLDAQTLSARLPPRKALLMLARGEAGELLAIALLHPAAGREGPLLQAVRLDGATARLDAVQTMRQLRQALRPMGLALRRAADALEDLPSAGIAPPTLAQAEADAQRLHAAVVEQALRPLLRRVADCGVVDVALVPSADLHLLPYQALLDPVLDETGCRLTLYPSCGAFAQHGLRAPPPAAEPVWAVMAQGMPAGETPLHWVALEQALSVQLWGPDRVAALDPAAPRARGVNALLGMGHGSAPQDNLARAGLLTGPGRVLSAHELPAIHTCRQVLLSCCVLARIDEVHAEAMGFLSSSFGYHTHFGVGWRIEVPDAEACLFSLAFQFALQAAPARRKAGWSPVFDATRRGIRDGAWPAGFGAWLGMHLPAAVAAATAGGPWLNRYEYLRDFEGLFSAPPRSLRRLMMWVVALGA
jgi:hypothetical protein